MATKIHREDRLSAALEWAALKPHDRNVRTYRARKSAPVARSEDPFSRFTSGPTATIRINRRLIALASEAWPDAQTRKTEISKLIVMAALEVIKNRQHTDPAQ